MRLSRLLTHDRIVLCADLRDADRVLARVAGLLADQSHDRDRLVAELVRREQSGSTALGDGVAIPHARLDGLERPRAAFVSTRQALDFRAPDGAGVDMFFALLVPAHATGEHLAILAEIAECFGDDAVRTMLRRAQSAQTVIEILSDSLTGAAA
jgi:PTS system nitrogen regulatory IIA component